MKGAVITITRKLRLAENVVRAKLRLHHIVRPGKVQILRKDILSIVGGGHKVGAHAGVQNGLAFGIYRQLLNIANSGVGCRQNLYLLLILRSKHGPGYHHGGTGRHQQ